jgi:hypothetical protein
MIMILSFFLVYFKNIIKKLFIISVYRYEKAFLHNGKLQSDNFGDNLNNVRRESSRKFRNKKREMKSNLFFTSPCSPTGG